MQKKIKEYMKKWKMLEKGDTVVLGISGGADSVCLLLILLELKKEWDLTIIGVHVNHGIRGEKADADEQYVKELCGRYQIPLEVIHADVRAIAKEQKQSEEEAGREVRRKAFEQVMRTYQGDKIALAHHQDDNAETFLFHLARGSRLNGLGGIQPVNGCYIRPLLCVRRKEIEVFLKERQTAYCVDATNLEDEYTRNRIRHHLIPYLCEEVNEKAVEHISGAMEQFREIRIYLEHQVAKVYAHIVKEQNGMCLIQKEELQKEEPLIQKMILRKALIQMTEHEKDLEEIHVNQLFELFEKQTGRKIDLPYGIEGLRTYEGLQLKNKVEKEQREEAVTIDLTKEGSVRWKEKTLCWRMFPADGLADSIQKKTFTKWFDYDIIMGSIVLRTRQKGDRIVIDKEGRTQKLKSYFINEKIPSEIRDQVPLIAKENDLLWIIGYRQSKKYQVTEHTKTILEIALR